MVTTHHSFPSLITGCIAELVEGCEVSPDDSDVDGQTLNVKYPTIYPSADVDYYVNITLSLSDRRGRGSRQLYLVH